MKIVKFKEIYLSKTNKKAAKELGISEKTLIKYARQLGLKKRKGFGNTAKIIFD